VTFQRLLVLNLALLALMILASRLALVIHEGGGHAVPATMLGARKVTIRLSALGGGFVSVDYPQSHPPSKAGVVIFDLGGIALNLLTGAGAWFWARRLKTRELPYIALLFVGVGSVAGAILYLTCGFYYGSGDPVGFAPATEDISNLQWAWVLFLPAAAAVAWLGARHYLDFLSGHVQLDSPRRRIGWMLATVGAAGLCYFGLWLALRNPQIEGSTAQWRLEREIEKETVRRTEVEAARTPVPTPLHTPPPAQIVVRAEEVADRVPAPVGPLVLYGTFAVSGMAALWRARPSPATAESRPAIALGLAALAAGIVTAFALWG
jgi:phosphatidylglycerophosphate synthase